METTPKPSAYFRECCPFYYLWKSEWYFYILYFYILWCSYCHQKKECGNFYSCVKTVNSGVVWVRSSRRSDTAFHSCSKCASKREAPPHGRHFRGFSTEHKYALVVWECPEDVRGRTKEDHCASTAAAWANSILSLHFLKLICRACPNRPSDTSLLCQTHSRLSTCFWCRDPDGFPEWTESRVQLQWKDSWWRHACHAWVYGEDITVLLSTFLERNIKHFTPSVVLFLRRLDHSMIMISRW